MAPSAACASARVPPSSRWRVTPQALIAERTESIGIALGLSVLRMDGSSETWRIAEKMVSRSSCRSASFGRRPVQRRYATSSKQFSRTSTSASWPR